MKKNQLVKTIFSSSLLPFFLSGSNSWFVLIAFFSATTFFTSCCEDEDDESNVPETVEDAQAGTFTIQNLATRGFIVKAADVIDEDTLLVVFNPKSEYQNYPFQITCRELTKVNDSIFVVPYKKEGTYKAEFKASCVINDAKYQATQAISFNVPKSYISIPMIVTVSSDLKPFIDVELSYTDQDGKECKFLIPEEEWIKPDSAIIYTYETEDGNIAYSGKMPNGYKILEVGKYAPSPFFTMDARFLNIKNDVTTTFMARYLPKANSNLDRDSYDFSHGIDRKSAKISLPGKIVIDTYISLSIDLTDHTVPKDEVTSYLDELSQKPDSKKFTISTSGSITTTH